MRYEAELQFFQRLLRNFHLTACIACTGDAAPPEFDLGLRRLIYDNADYAVFLSDIQKQLQHRTVYFVKDRHLCCYVLFRLPDTPDDAVFFIGPFTRTAITREQIFHYAQKQNIPPHLLVQLEKYYLSLPLIPDENPLMALVNTFGETLWGCFENFTLKYSESDGSDYQEPFPIHTDNPRPDDAFLSMQILESRYLVENQLIQAVSQGLLHKAEMTLATFSGTYLEQRLADPIRNIKNYCIILNTLLRKAAEAGSVHPLYIDSLSSSFAIKIELVSSVSEGYALQHEMIRKYCILVNNYSTKGYSLLVRKVLIQIDSDLTADLSLSALAALLNVNASYLSTLFKKDTGVTLTGYVNHKRINHAVFLLNTTQMQIQAIAQCCGIPDVNYFTKTFKKYIGTTPKEYRESIAP